MKKVLAFAVAALLIYPIMVLIWSSFVPKEHIENMRYPLGGGGHLHSRLNEAKRHGPVDIVFLGSSRTYRVFDTRIWAEHGYSVFNLGSSAQSPIQTELIVKEYLAPLRPKLVIYEVYGLLAKIDGVESSLDLIANRPLDMATAKMAWDLQNIKVLNSLIYGAYRKWSGQDEGFIEPRENHRDRYIDGGFVERLDTSRITEDARSMEYMEPPRHQLEAFERTIADLRADGYKVILVSTPSTEAHLEQLQKRSPEYLEWLKDQPELLNMNAIPELMDTALYYDQHHPKQRGVELINSILMDSLYARGYLPLTGTPNAQ